MSLPGHCSRTHWTSFQLTAGSNCVAIHCESVTRPGRAGHAPFQIAEAAASSEKHAECPARPGSDFEGISQGEARRHGKAVLEIVATHALHLQIECQHDRRAFRCPCARDQLAVEAAIPHEIELKPERFGNRPVHIFDRTDRQGTQAERYSECLGGTCTDNLAIPIEQARESGGTDSDWHRRRFARHRRRNRLGRHIDRHSLAERDRLEICPVAPDRDFVVGATISVVEDGAGNTSASELAQVRNARDHCHPLLSPSAPTVPIGRRDQ